MSYGKRINMWSGPRNISTAVMYSFAQRPDSRVVDEPFYAHYLLQSGTEHPGREKVLESQPKDPAGVLQNLLAHNTQKDLLFLKNMAHHMVKMDAVLDKMIQKFQHIFLIRDPADMLLSLDKKLRDPTLRDTAYDRQLELFNKVKSEKNHPVVIDAKELLKNPKHVLSELCRRLDIPFFETMLSWEAGPIPEDGIWAKHWYGSVHQSTGFKPYVPKQEDIPERLKPLYEECNVIYEQMFVHAIKTKS